MQCHETALAMSRAIPDRLIPLRRTREDVGSMLRPASRRATKHLQPERLARERSRVRRTHSVWLSRESPHPLRGCCRSKASIAHGQPRCFVVSADCGRGPGDEGRKGRPKRAEACRDLLLASRHAPGALATNLRRHTLQRYKTVSFRAARTIQSDESSANGGGIISRRHLTGRVVFLPLPSPPELI